MTYLMGKTPAHIGANYGTISHYILIISIASQYSTCLLHL